MVFDERAYLAANPDVAAAIQSGMMPNARFHYDNHGAAEMAAGTRAPVAMTGAAPVPAPASIDRNPLDYASRYHEIRGIDTDFGALGMDVPDYSTTAVNTAAHRNPFHYVNSQTGELNRDQLQQEIQSGAFRFNPDYYAAQNPDLAAAGLTSGTDLMNHFLDYGWNEGRNYAIENPNFTSDISNGFGGTVSGVTGSALPQFQDMPLPGSADASGGSMADRFSEFTDMFMGQLNSFKDQWGQQQQQSQQPDPSQNMWGWNDNAAVYNANGWNTPYNQSPTVPAVYQPGQGNASNGFASLWGQSNPFSIRTF